MRPEDRYRFVLLMSFEDIYEAHMWSQNCLTREEINAGQCGIGAIFRAMAVEDPNDSSWISYTEAMLSLHPHFASPIECKKGSYEWTDEKLKNHQQFGRNNIVWRYELSGNGSNQAIHEDSDHKPDLED